MTGTGKCGKAALVLTGGGARAAYQAGVLQAIRELLPDPHRNPFPIICGTSAGAINAATLAVHSEDFSSAVDHLHKVWSDIHVHQVYKSDPLTLATTGVRWLSSLMLGWVVRQTPHSLLDNAPLAELLHRKLDFSALDRAIEKGALYALSITASGYSSGQSISFFQGAAEIEPWERTQRHAVRVRLEVDHLLASSAIPFLFPATHIHREYFGDGSMRQLAPVSPAIHLGADRVLVVGAGRMNEPPLRRRTDEYPSLAQIAGHALSTIFLDGLAVDIERMQRINRTLSIIPEEIKSRHGLVLRPIETLVIAPSERLDFLAARHVGSLPLQVRLLLRSIGAMSKNGSALASYLLFEQPYTQALIDLGYRDTMARDAEVREFLIGD